MKQYKKLKNKINELIEKINELIRASNDRTVIMSSKINEVITSTNDTYAKILEMNDKISKWNCPISDKEVEMLNMDIKAFTENEDICNPKYLFAIKDLKEDKIVFSARGGAYKTLKNAKLGIDKLVSKSNGRKLKDDYKIIAWKLMD